MSSGMSFIALVNLQTVSICKSLSSSRFIVNCLLFLATNSINILLSSVSRSKNFIINLDRIIASGSLERLAHGEERPKGYVRVDGDEWHFIESPDEVFKAINHVYTWPRLKESMVA